MALLISLNSVLIFSLRIFPDTYLAHFTQPYQRTQTCTHDFQCLAILNGVAMITFVHVILWAVFSITLDKYLGRKLLSYIVSVCIFNFVKHCQVVYPSGCVRVPLFYILLNTWYFSFYKLGVNNFSYPSACVAVFHWLPSSYPLHNHSLTLDMSE